MPFTVLYKIEDSSGESTNKWLVVFTTSILYEAQMLKSNLESANIPVQILSQQDSTRNFTFGELSIIKVFVLEEDFETAMEFINSTFK